MLTAEDIFHSQLENWGQKDAYLVTEEEFSVLSKSAEKIEAVKQPNGDGTFYSALVFRGFKFVCAS
jgi:hypothetical protein